MNLGVAKKLFDKARTTMDFFSGHPGQDEVAEVDALFEQARIELKALSGSHYDTVRAGLRSQFNELKEKLQPYKGDISDSQQTTATNSEVNQRIELVKKECNDYWKEYGRQSKDLEEQVLKCSQSAHPGELRIDKLKDLRKFYEKSLETAKVLRFEKLSGLPALENERLSLNDNIDQMRTRINVLNQRLKQEQEQENVAKRSGCTQS
ncbi:hypothetical protein [Endozoicomonas sp. SCSIO W0465]|uniref:hypothetical protein n=1 Tax=Endozoicomonas sp. SCSIO W0465 TaxID=2918516 RepID=UPI0020752F00|nr:hypothetical protein [Endozoicomonas sp. SCSIO W0465]USE38502.1 hypothetical protein MJO57_10230 [Endozoicomonas sp. SCSIO W0465]